MDPMTADAPILQSATVTLDVLHSGVLWGWYVTMNMWAKSIGTGVLLVGVAITGLVLSFQDAAVYAKTVDQLVADKAKMAGRAVRVEGNLVKGSLVHQEKPCEYRFRMAEKGAEIPVRYAQCVVPDTFRDVPGMDVRVTVEGKMSAEGTFEATLVMAKCPSKYEMKDRQTKGEAAPHQPTLPTN